MLQRLMWKLLPKAQRRFLLGRLSVVDRQAVNKVMSARTQFPAPFQARRCLFIHVPKCAGSSVCGALFDGWYPGHLPLHWYEAQFPQHFAASFKFAFVRDPLERAYSAWCYLHGERLPGRDAPARELVRSYTSFDGFVGHWLDSENAQRQLHFAPQTDFLVNGMGRLAMDFIGHQEQMDADFARVCRHFGIDVPLPRHNVSAARTAASARELVSARTRRLVRRVYQRDYEWLGYE